MRVSSMETSVTINKKKAVLLSIVMLGLMVGGSVLVPLLRETGERMSDSYYIWSAVLSVAALVFLLVFERNVLSGKVAWLIPLVFLISIILFLLFDRPLQMPFWCFGGILLVCGFKLRFGMVLNYYFLFLAGSTQNPVIKEAVVMQVLCLMLLGLTMPYAKKWKDAVEIIVSVFAVLVSVRILFFFLERKSIKDTDIFYLALVYIIVVIISVYFANLLREASFRKKKEATFDYLEELAVSVEAQDTELLNEILFEKEQEEAALEAANLSHEVPEPDTEADKAFYGSLAVAEQPADEEALTALCAENAPLLEQLRISHRNAYLHARRVALLSSEIAENLEGVQNILVKAGGYYHEIGRLLGKNTMDNTLLVAEREGFPAELCDVLREHSVNGDKPTTKEAALVLLTDNICSMCEYLKKNQSGRLLIDKVIDKALNLRLSKGDLNDSGLTVKEFSVIRNSMAELMKEDMF